MAINLDHVTEQITVTDTAANADLTLVSKGTGVVNLNTGNGTQFRVGDTFAGGTATNFYKAQGTAGGGVVLVADGASTNIPSYLASKGTSPVIFTTGGVSVDQMRVAHTASAVNYVQATGGVTGVGVALSAQGSDSNIAMLFQAKGTQFHLFQTNGANQFGVAPTASAVNYVQVTGSSTGFAPYFITQGSDTNISFAYSAKGTGAHDFYTNGFSFAQQLKIAHTASAVNYVQVSGSATGGSPAISAVGSDASVGLSISSKSNANIIFNSGGTTRAIIDPFGGVFLGVSFSGGVAFQALALSNQVNFIRAAGAATGSDPVISAQGSDTNIDLVLQPKGTGALQAQLTDSTATGGNARGTNAVDWQTSRGSASMVASGSNSVLVGGQNNTSSSYASFLGAGANNYSQASNSFVGAGNSNLVNLSGIYAAIVAGNGNTVQGYANFVGAGTNNSGTSGSAVTTQSATMNGTTAVTLSGSNASIKVGQLIAGTSIAGETYVAAISGTSLTLSKVASGSSTSTLSFFTPHGVVVGGGNNTATGSYSFIGGGGDAGTAGNRNVASGGWSSVLGGLKNTASGVGSVVCGGGTYDGANGGGNTASGLGAFVGAGWGSLATADGSSVLGSGNAAISKFSTAMGQYSNTRGIIGNFVISPCDAPMSALYTNQIAFLVLARQTTDATPTVLTSNSSAASTNNQVILPNNSAYFFTGEVVAGVTGGGNTKGWTIEGVIKRGANAAATTLVGSTVTSMYADVGAATWTIAVTADTTNGGLAVTFTGQAATTIRCVAQIRTTEMTY
jgi:hypothetical protein